MASPMNLAAHRPPSLPDLLDPNFAYPIFERLCPMLPIGDLISLTRTCKALSGLYQHRLKRDWDINTMLSRYFTEPRQFRSLMGKHNAFIAGSFAVEYFERATWRANNLDIIAKSRPDFEPLLEFVESEGYCEYPFTELVAQ